MTQPGSLMVVHFVESQLEGWTFERAHWPLHITLVPWFNVDDETAVLRRLDKATAGMEPFMVTVGGMENFGADGDVPVNTLAHDSDVHELHRSLIAIVGKADPEAHKQRYIGKYYVPHITRHEDDERYSNEGEELEVDDFHLVRLIDERTCLVVKRFELGAA